MSTVHRLKTWPAYYDAVARGDKTFEARKNDRDFQTGDTVVLEWFDPAAPPRVMMEVAWGNKAVHPDIPKLVTYTLHGGQFGIDPGYVVLGLGPVPSNEGPTA